MAADICVAVTKYSHATGVKPDNTIPWTHVVASNIYLVLNSENSGFQVGDLSLLVVQANTTLETIRCSELIDKAMETWRLLQQAGSTPHIEQLPIFGICKDMFLAIRYRLSDGQARRVQFRLQSTHECDRIVGILQQRGMEFQQQRPRTGRPSSGRPSTTESEARPLTMQTSSPAQREPAASDNNSKPSPFRLPDLEAGGLSSHFPSSDSGPLTGQTLSRQLSHAASAHAGTLGNFNPSTASSQPGHSKIHSLQVLGVSTPLELIHGCDVSQRGMSITNQPASDAASPLPTSNNLTASDSLGRATYHNFSDYSLGLSSDGRVSLDNRLNTLRPSIPMPETLEHEIPPRRELPFKRPSSHSSASSRLSTASKAAHRSTTVEISSESAGATTFHRPTSRPVTASPLKRAIMPIDDRPGKKVAAAVRPQTSTLSSSTLPVNSSTSTRPLAPQFTGRRPHDLGELLRRSKPLTDRSANSNKAGRLDSLADAEYELETPSGTSAGPDKLGEKTAGTSHVQQNRGIENEPVSTAGIAATGINDGVDTNALAGYASRSREDRQAALDEFMISKLSDPNFAVLCEDLDNCWRRIALGL